MSESSKEILKKYFGYDSFRKGQEDVINAIMSGKDVLAVMPTGAGKSLCYQVPALLFSGITLVISPLISLMQDQVRLLNEAGIHAAYLNSSLTMGQYAKALDMAGRGIFKIIYVAPERLETAEFLSFAMNADVSMVTVDEAHCVSQWGQDFRKSYRDIVKFVSVFKKRPVISAFTATATAEVRNDIVCLLGLSTDYREFISGFDRENLYYSVRHAKDKAAFTLNYINRHKDESGIIYCATRKGVDETYDLLLREGYAVSKYHAGMGNNERKQSQDDFIYDRSKIIVATNAFGMGIDKPDVRYVLHYNMPQSMENYYQEAGRAGRDSLKADCCLLFSMQDVMVNKFLLEKKDFEGIFPEDIDALKQNDIKKLNAMEGYCKTSGCLRKYILNYFGEHVVRDCGNCGNCDSEFKEMDMTEAAKWVINCVVETKGRYGTGIVIGTLRGAKRARLMELGTDKYKSFGRLHDESEPVLKMLIDQMLMDGLLIRSNDMYGVLRMGDISSLKNDEKYFMHYRDDVDKSARRDKPKSTDCLTGEGFGLFEKLRTLRMEIARGENVPPYIVFGDKTLIDMVVKTPRNKEEMLRVSGVGENKYSKYGEKFIEVITDYLLKFPDAVLSMETEGSGAYAKKKAAPRSLKPEFRINKEDAENFVYAKHYYASEIAKKMNEICSVFGVKKLTFGKVWEFLVEEGLVEEIETDGKSVKIATEKGKDMGVITVDKEKTNGEKYTLLMYPENVQKMVVEHFVG